MYVTHATHVKIRTHVKHILTNVTHATHVKIWPTDPRTHWPMHPRNPRYHATQAI